jgi:hypothetical protein
MAHWIALLGLSCSLGVHIYGQCGTEPAPCDQPCGNLCMDNWECPGSAVPVCVNFAVQCQNQNPNSPIVIDAFGEGFHLANVNDGVEFRFTQDQPPYLLSWTDPKWRNGPEKAMQHVKNEIFMRTLSYRALLGRAVVCCLLLAMQIPSHAQSDNMPIKNPLQGEGISVIDSTSPGFASEVAKFLDPPALAKASSFLPYSLIVVNNTGRYIWSFTVIYTLPNRISPAGTPWQYRISPTAAGPPHRRLMLAPGGSYLVTPVNDFVASRGPDGRSTFQPYLDEGLERIIEIFEVQDSKERMEASIDSIIYEDGTLAGPDSAQRMDKVNIQIRVQKDLSSISGLRGDELRKELLLYSGLATADEYSRYKSRVAKSSVGLLDEGKEAMTVEVLDKFQRPWFVNADTARRRQQ